MKKFKILLLATTCLGALAATGCNQKAEIGILQFGDFPALNNAREGFLQALKDGGFGDKIVDYQNAQVKSDENSKLAKTMASKYSLNYAIATPCATALKAELENTGKENPLIFSAVTDPVGAGLVENKDAPEGFVTGASDLQPDEALHAQISLVKSMLPDATRLGIFYCSSESNSEVQAVAAKAIAEEDGLEVEIKTCSDQFDVSSKVLDLSNSVDAIWIPTDNVVSDNIAKVKEALTGKKILVISGEEGMVAGCHVSVSIDYFKLGQKAGEMACQILNGTPIREIPVFYPTLEDCSYVYSKNNLEACGFSVSDLPEGNNWVNVD